MMLTKAVSILFFVLSSLQVKAIPADTLVVIFDRQNFVQGDSIEIEIYTEPYRSNQPAQTLHLWIENVKTGQRWKYRYPFLKGRYKIALKINESIPDGIYALNFLLQDKFLAVKGKLINATKLIPQLIILPMQKRKLQLLMESVCSPVVILRSITCFILTQFCSVFRRYSKKKKINSVLKLKHLLIPLSYRNQLPPNS